jgi:hypothetical protein
MRIAAVVWLGLVAGCQLSANFDHSPEVGDASVAFGTIGGGTSDGGGGGGTNFGDRLGPGTPYGDSLSETAVPTGALTVVQMLDGGYFPPDLLIGTTASYVNNSTLLVAFDLASKTAHWTGALPLARGRIASDGADTLCGFVNLTTDLACLSASTGALLFRKPTGLANAQITQLEILFASGRVFLYAGTDYAGTVFAFDVQSGAQLWTQASVLVQGRGLLFVGGDLVLGRIAVNPATGATLASTAQNAGLLWEANGKAYFQTRDGKMALSYDPATHAWADATAALSVFFASFQTGAAATLSNPDCAALTGVASDGTVYGTIRSFSGGATGALCRWNAITQATAWCVAVGRLPLEFRAHPNRIFLDGKVLDAATGQAVSDTYRLFFGHYAFASNQVFGVN